MSVFLPALGTAGSASKGNFLRPGSDRTLQFATQLTWPALLVYTPVCSPPMFKFGTPV